MQANLNFHSLGLRDAEVADSRTKHGRNELTPPKKEPVWKLYLENFKDPIIQILLVAAVFSLIISFIENDFAESIGIFCAIFCATGIGFYFEYDASKKFALLNAIGAETNVRVIRNGKVCEVPKSDIVVGDIVLLETGEEIPADGELLDAVSLSVNESSLTGELQVAKTTDPAHFDSEATYPSNEVMRGTTVLDGHGVMRVKAVGDATEIGKVANKATEKSEEKTPLNIQLTRLAKVISKWGTGISILAFVLFTAEFLYTYFTTLNGAADWLFIVQNVLKFFMMAVTLIVMAVPEGLPMAITLSLALNMRRMLATNNLVRKMHACETMGAINVICTDKTGTLTQNKMQVADTHFDNDAIPSEEILFEALSANTTAYLDEANDFHGVGNPTECALLLWMHNQDIDYLKYRENAPVIDQLTFSTERKYMATFVKSGVTGKKLLFVKGAPEIIMQLCAGSRSDAFWKKEREQLLSYQQRAMRTLAFAYKEVVDEQASLKCEQLIKEGGLEYMGIVAISDPIRPEVPGAVKKCQSAGINIKIVTGDTTATAKEIARQIGLWKPEDKEDESIITGTEFAALSDDELNKRIDKLKVIARARPLDKQRLVQTLQKKGYVVAVTGDGTNDAPALNHAQVGLSMGSGTSVAKQASDITLLDDSFRSIATAVMWGRSLYHNLQRFIMFQLTINVVALTIVLIGSFLNIGLPLTVTQILWVNIIMDTLAAMALASIPPTEDVMQEKPRKQSDFIITKGMARFIFGVGAILFVVLFAMLVYFKQTSVGEVSVHDLTIFFTTFVMLQFWNLFNVKGYGSKHAFVSKLSHSYGLLLAGVLILAGQFIIVQFGGKVFRTEPLSGMEWLLIFVLTSLVLWGGELLRFLERVKTKKA